MPHPTFDVAETWIPAVGYDGLYEVSDQGRVRSLRTAVPLILSPRKRGAGYLGVALFKDGMRHECSVHRLIAEAFLGTDRSNLEVAHNDGDATNNRPSNLRWATRIENMHDQRVHGTNAQLRKTHCRIGHPYSARNTYVDPRGWRQCRTCRDASWRKKSA